jgi:hypothetical protein
LEDLHSWGLPALDHRRPLVSVKTRASFLWKPEKITLEMAGFLRNPHHHAHFIWL